MGDVELAEWGPSLPDRVGVGGKAQTGSVVLILLGACLRRMSATRQVPSRSYDIAPPLDDFMHHSSHVGEWLLFLISRTYPRATLRDQGGDPQEPSGACRITPHMLAVETCPRPQWTQAPHRGSASGKAPARPPPRSGIALSLVWVSMAGHRQLVRIVFLGGDNRLDWSFTRRARKSVFRMLGVSGRTKKTV